MVNEGPNSETEGENTDELQGKLAEERAQAEANLAGWQRAQADLVNYKRRSEQEKEETVKFGNAALLLSLLPVLDDFERASSSFPAEASQAGWVEGFRLIERKLRAILEAQGLSRIKTAGELFDPRVHEAVSQGRGKEGIIINEVEKGYKLNDRVLRPAKVVVGNGEEP